MPFWVQILLGAFLFLHWEKASALDKAGILPSKSVALQEALGKGWYSGLCPLCPFQFLSSFSCCQYPLPLVLSVHLCEALLNR